MRAEIENTNAPVGRRRTNGAALDARRACYETRGRKPWSLCGELEDGEPTVVVEVVDGDWTGAVGFTGASPRRRDGVEMGRAQAQIDLGRCRTTQCTVRSMIGVVEKRRLKPALEVLT